jgi:hypothetical protein
MHSAYVRQEWEYALSLGRQNFVRPTYWETPLPESATENLPPAELRRLHFQHLRSSTIGYHPTAATSNSDDAEAPSQTPTAQAGRGEAVASAQPGGGEIVCASCGARNPPEKAFCMVCAMSLSAPAPSRARQPVGAQPTDQPAGTHARDSGGVLDIFWEKRSREHQPTEMFSYVDREHRQALIVLVAKRPLLSITILLFIVVAVYLLVRLL